MCFEVSTPEEKISLDPTFTDESEPSGAPSSTEFASLTTFSMFRSLVGDFFKTTGETERSIWMLGSGGGAFSWPDLELRRTGLIVLGERRSDLGRRGDMDLVGLLSVPRAPGLILLLLLLSCSLSEGRDLPGRRSRRRLEMGISLLVQKGERREILDANVPQEPDKNTKPI